MKKLIFSLLLALCVISVNAQEKGKIRVGGNLGLTVPPAGAGLSIDLLDIRYNILDNLNIGVKFGGAFMLRDAAQIGENMAQAPMRINSNFMAAAAAAEYDERAEATMHINSNFMLVGDYYFNKGTSAFAPFVGAGIGSFSIFDLYMQVESGEEYNYEYEELPVSSKVIGGALRAGFEFGKFRMALEYYLLPQTPKYDVANIMYQAGTSGNSYLSLNIGFYFGGGKWRKSVE